MIETKISTKKTLMKIEIYTKIYCNTIRTAKNSSKKNFKRLRNSTTPTLTPLSENKSKH